MNLFTLEILAEEYKRRDEELNLANSLIENAVEAFRTSQEEILGDDFDPEQDLKFNHMLGEDPENDIVERGRKPENFGMHDLQLPSSDAGDPSVTTELLSYGTIEEPEFVRYSSALEPSHARECLRPIREQQREQWKTELAATQVALIVEWSQVAVYVKPGDAKATLCEVFARGGTLKSLCSAAWMRCAVPMPSDRQRHRVYEALYCWVRLTWFYRASRSPRLL
ncbi:hypothetical protein BGZ65_009778 [Modicella reniformis]|uniref:Uncharacterized protein n=1 Tax=Modicella reniformis TaxID=1440133 RepID=A0A9P6ML20_9FUNG|nr:hypothetical protein BGZ65_009778 [Modicella reniformis]